MASSVLPNPHGTNLEEREGKSIIAGLSKQEVLDLVKTTEIPSWDGVFYHLDLPWPKSGEEKSAERLGINYKLLAVWIQREDRSRSQLIDILEQLHEKDIAIHVDLLHEMELLKRSVSYRSYSSLIESVQDNLKERQMLAKAKFTAYLSSLVDDIPISDEPVETLAKRFLEGCFTEMDFSTVQEKEAILLKALTMAGFAEVPQRFQLNEIVACFQNKEQLLSTVRALNKLSQYCFSPVIISGYGMADFRSLDRFALDRMSVKEWKIILQRARDEAGLRRVHGTDPFEDKDEMTVADIRTVSMRLPVEKAEDLGLALGFQKEEVDTFRTLTMCNCHAYNTLCVWNKRTPFSRHRLFLALCLSGYSTLATSNLYGMGLTDTYVTKSFSRSGENITLEDEGIQLSIPMGALAENQRITLHLLEEGPLMPSAEEVSVCPGFRVSPSGLSFYSRVKVTMDHSATILQQDRASQEGIVVYVRQEEGPKEQWKVVRYDLSTSTDCPVEVILTNDKVELYLTHFTSFWIRIKTAFIKNKRIACTPFLPKYMPANRKPVLRLYIHSISRGTLKMIREEEENSCPMYHQTTPHYPFRVIPNGQGLTVTCYDEGRIVPKTVSFENLLTLRKQAPNRLEFELDFSSLKHCEKNVKVDLFQGVEERREKMIIPTTFKVVKMESGDGQSADETIGLGREHRQSHEEPCVSEGEISARLDTLHLGSTLDMPLPGACASVSLDKVTYEQLVEIADAIPGESFVAFFVYLGFDMDYPYKVLERWSCSYRSASEQLLSEWARNHQNDKDLLREALKKSKLQFLAFQYLSS